MSASFKSILWSLFAGLFFNQVASQEVALRCPAINATITNGPIVNLCTGTSVTLNAIPAAGPYVYQWQEQLIPGTPFTNIGGATGPNHTVSNLGAYRIIISQGACIDTSAITNVIRLTVDAGTISSPIPGLMVCEGSTAGVINGTIVPGDGAGIISYQWQIKLAGGGFTNIPGATGSSLTTGPIFGETSFRRIVTDNCSNSAISNELTFNIFPAFLAGSIAPSTQTINPGDIPALLTSSTNASGGSGNFSYFWQSSNYPGGPWSDIVGANASTYQPGALSITTYYRRIANDNVCITRLYSNTIEVKVNNSPLLPGLLLYSSNCAFPGQNPAIFTTDVQPTGGTPPYDIQWQSSIDNINWIDIPGANGSTYQSGPIAQSTYFRKKVTDAALTTVYTEVLFINLITTPLNPGIIEATSDIACLGSAPALIKSKMGVSGSGQLVYYEWELRTASTGWTAIPGSTSGDFQPSPITEKTWFRRVVYDGCGTNGQRFAISNEVEIDVRPEILPGNIEPNTQMILPGQTPMPLNNLVLASGGTGSYTYLWEEAPNGFGPFTVIPGENGISYQPPATSQTTYYRRGVKDNSCLATKYTFVVEVFVNNLSPFEPGNIMSDRRCVFPGQLPKRVQPGNIPPSGGLAPYTYEWEQKTASNPIWTVIAGETTQFYYPPAITETHTYRRKTIDAMGTFGYSNEITIEYITSPLIPGTIAPTNSNICPGNSPGIIKSTMALSTLAENPMYLWQQSTDGINWTDIPGTLQGDYTPGILFVTTYFRRMASDECGFERRYEPSNVVVINVGAFGRVDGGLISNANTCIDFNTSPGLIQNTTAASGGSGAYNYQWQMKIGTGIWKDIAGANGVDYTPGNLTATTSFRRKVTDGCGGEEFSNTIVIKVTWMKLKAGLVDGPFITCTGSAPGTINSVLDACGGGGTVAYQWEVNTGMGWSDIPGANAASYTPGAISFNTTYRRRASDECGDNAYSNEVTIYVYPPIEAGVIGPVDQTTCSTEIPAKLELATNCHYTDGTVTYQWQEAASAGGPWTDIGGATTPEYQPSASAITRYFRLKVSSTTCSMVAYTNISTITRNPGCKTMSSFLPVFTTVPAATKTEVNAKAVLNEKNTKNKMSVFPNPVTGREFFVTTTQPDNYNFVLMSINGAKLKSTITKMGDGNYKVSTMGQLPKGTYLLQMAGTKNQQTFKVIIQ